MVLPKTVPALAGILLLVAPLAAQPVALLPAPQALSIGDGGFFLDRGSAIAIPARDAGARAAADRLIDFFGKTDGIRLALRSNGSIRMERAPGYPAEGYELVTTRAGATITASSDAGLFYGAISLWQLAKRDQGRLFVPAVTINDAPRFGWRGLMLDSARHYQSPVFVKRLIDAMAANKLNTLHWHLVDDQGWRIEIRKYPALTRIAGTRAPATAAGAPPLPAIRGFYTQAQIREIVAYAAARSITIVPEIEMPGHALSAIRAYPKLGMGVPIPKGTESDWGVFPWLYNTDEATFRFLEDVLDEVMTLFPSRYIHIGGDEAAKEQWKASPAIQAQMKQLGIKTEDELQSWFVHRIGDYLAKRGRRLVGWDEILDGGITRHATVMSWRGIEGAVAAAKAGHDAILSPAPILYFDNRQGVTAAEETGRGHLVTLADVYAFDPAPAAIPPEQRRHILGLQGNVWAEHLRTEARYAAAAFPRAAAVAELGWSKAGSRDFGDFVRRLAPQMARLEALGITASPAVFRPVMTVSPAGEKLAVAIAGQSGLPLTYTLDGTAPSAQSALYAKPLLLDAGTRVRIAALLDGAVMPGALDVVLDAGAGRRRDDTQLKLCTQGVALRLEDDAPTNGRRAAFLTDIFNPCWVYEKAVMDGVTSIAIDVGQVPFNFQIGADLEKIRFRPPATRDGEVEVRDGCTGPHIAVLPLAPASGNPGVTRLSAPLRPMTGSHDLCITYTARGVEPMWAIASVQLSLAPFDQRSGQPSGQLSGQPPVAK